MKWPQRIARRAYWATIAIVALNFTLMVADIATHRYGWSFLQGSAVGASTGAALVWHHLIPRKIPPPAEPSRHDQCLSEIARLERELATDGVTFLMTPEEFDRAIEHAITGRTGVNADPAAVYVPRPEPERIWIYTEPKDGLWIRTKGKEKADNDKHLRDDQG